MRGYLFPNYSALFQQMKSIIDYNIQYLLVILNKIPQYDEFTKPINHRKKELTSIIMTLNFLSTWVIKLNFYNDYIILATITQQT